MLSQTLVYASTASASSACLLLDLPLQPVVEPEWESSDGEQGVATGQSGVFEIVLIAGFESFNVALYREAASAIRAQCPSTPCPACLAQSNLGSRRIVLEA